jgi:hypothetical protein
MWLGICSSNVGNCKKPIWIRGRVQTHQSGSGMGSSLLVQPALFWNQWSTWTCYEGIGLLQGAKTS